MRNPNEPCFLSLPYEDEEGNVVPNFKVSPHGDADPDRDAFWVDTRAEARAEVERLEALVVKPGREVLDPSNRRVYVLSVDGDQVTVRLGGTLGTTVRYSRSMLRPVEG
jgi:hypothetical protein